jgi:hypothetical protein
MQAVKIIIHDKGETTSIKGWGHKYLPLRWSEHPLQMITLVGGLLQKLVLLVMV